MIIVSYKIIGLSSSDSGHEVGLLLMFMMRLSVLGIG